MSTEIQKKPESPLKTFFSRDDVKSKFNEVMGRRGTSFVASVLTIATSNTNFTNCDPASIYMAAMTAATLGLEINPNLGFAYVIPYGKQAQFQIGYKGLIQLGQRSGLYLSMGSEAVYEGQLISHNPMGISQFDWSIPKVGEPIGYAAEFQLLNGFCKTEYWTKEKVLTHAKKFSKTFSNGPWKTDFDAMAKKTVLKYLIGHYGPMSIEMQMAQKFDQAVVHDVESEDITYVDNGKAEIDVVDLMETLEKNEAQFSPLEYKSLKEIIVNAEEASYPKIVSRLKEIIGE